MQLLLNDLVDCSQRIVRINEQYAMFRKKLLEALECFFLLRVRHHKRMRHRAEDRYTEAAPRFDI